MFTELQSDGITWEDHELKMHALMSCCLTVDFRIASSDACNFICIYIYDYCPEAGCLTRSGRINC